jgi:Transposase DDE domain group 1
MVHTSSAQQQSTLNRLEHGAPEVGRYRRIAHDVATLVGQRVFGIALGYEDLADHDRLHGHQEGRFFHGCCDCHCSLPLYVFCGRHLLAAKLRRSNIDASAGAVEEVARIIGQIRARWPRVRIVLRGDGGFARDVLMSWCEANRATACRAPLNPRRQDPPHSPPRNPSATPR